MGAGAGVKPTFVQLMRLARSRTSLLYCENWLASGRWSDDLGAGVAGGRNDSISTLTPVWVPAPTGVALLAPDRCRRQEPCWDTPPSSDAPAGILDAAIGILVAGDHGAYHLMSSRSQIFAPSARATSNSLPDPSISFDNITSSAPRAKRSHSDFSSGVLTRNVMEWLRSLDVIVTLMGGVMLMFGFGSVPKAAHDSHAPRSKPSLAAQPRQHVLEEEVHGAPEREDRREDRSQYAHGSLGIGVEEETIHQCGRCPRCKHNAWYLISGCVPARLGLASDHASGSPEAGSVAFQNLGHPDAGGLVGGIPHGNGLRGSADSGRRGKSGRGPILYGASSQNS